MTFEDRVDDASRAARVARRKVKGYVAGVNLRVDVHIAGTTKHGLVRHFQRKVGNQADTVDRQLEAVDGELAQLGRSRRRHLRVVALRARRARLRRTAGQLEEVRKVES